MRRRIIAGAAMASLMTPVLARSQGTGPGHAHAGQEQKIGSYEVELVVRGSEANLTILEA